jgi:hypothetical protein
MTFVRAIALVFASYSLIMILLLLAGGSGDALLILLIPMIFLAALFDRSQCGLAGCYPSEFSISVAAGVIFLASFVIFLITFIPKRTAGQSR